MRIKWNGHASFTITTSDGIKIITDPYEPGGFSGAIKYGKIPDKADIITVSHEHADHNYVDGIAGNPKVVKKSETVKGIEFKGVPTYHDKSKGSERGQNTIFVFKVDGVTLCHLGDLGHTLPDDVANKIGKVDILFLPIGGTFTVDPNEAAKVMEKLSPIVTIPMHYKTEKCGFPIAKLDDFLHGKEAMTVELKKSEVEVDSKSLPKKKEIWVLSHAC
jgi:L-ascorbate metabolism protein UlaG (beta-lactamase superfamily)